MNIVKTKKIFAALLGVSMTISQSACTENNSAKIESSANENNPQSFTDEITDFISSMLDVIPARDVNTYKYKINELGKKIDSGLYSPQEQTVAKFSITYIYVMAELEWLKDIDIDFVMSLEELAADMHGTVICALMDQDNIDYYANKFINQSAPIQKKVEELGGFKIDYLNR